MTPCEQETDAARRLVADFGRETSGQGYGIKAQDYPAGRAILEAEPRLQIAAIFQIYEEIQSQRALQFDSLLTALLARHQPFTPGELERLLRIVAPHAYWGKRPTVVRHVRRFVDEGNALMPGMRETLQKIREAVGRLHGAESRKLLVAVDELLGGGRGRTQPEAGEAWADIARADLAALPEAARAAWEWLFYHAQTADGSRPTKQWRETAALLVAGIGGAFVPAVARWFGAVTLPPVRTQRNEYGDGEFYEWRASAGSDKNVSLLKGLAWCCAPRTEPEVARALARMAEACLKKIPGVGPWAVRAAGGAVWALGEMPCGESVTALSALKLRVTHRGTVNQIERTIETVAQRQGIAREDLEELAVPTYGLDREGRRREEWGEYAAEMTLDAASGEVALRYFGPGGKPLKSAPAALKRDHGDDLKALKADADAAGKMLTAQRQRIEAFLLAERTWTLGAWRARYLDHPLLGHIARRLVWCFEGSAGLWDRERDAFVDAENKPLAGLTDGAAVRLWHPIGAPAESVLRWRALLEERRIRQPFKQAHREVYLLTDAERATRTYSNRFAGHLLKQHQMNQLALLRGWKNQLRLMVDDSYPPATLHLPRWNLRVEFWVEGAGDNFGADTTDSGTYLYLTTDQVRFYPLDAPANYAHAGGGGYYGGGWPRSAPAEPLPLTEVPPLVFSEVMRDVDLFVGVASVGNDPAWSDGGPEGHHRDYWQEYAFGELSATAKTRAEVLARLLPRLKIAPRCRLDGRFLVVQGDRRTYKIHLGSGNILMEPNDQYLCIVQDRSALATTGDAGALFLPFEGDARLSLILSKALLLAEDTKITDPSILRQIQGR